MRDEDKSESLTVARLERCFSKFTGGTASLTYLLIPHIYTLAGKLTKSKTKQRGGNQRCGQQVCEAAAARRRVGKKYT